MSMSKKDFVALADALRDAELFRNADTVDIASDVLARIVRFCHAQNGAFKEERWLGYLRGECGAGGGKVR